MRHNIALFLVVLWAMVTLPGCSRNEPQAEVLSSPESPTPVSLAATSAPSSASAATPEPTVTVLPAATDVPAATATSAPLPTAEPLPAGWTWYENTTYGPSYFRIAYPETWTVAVGLQRSGILQSSGISYRAIFTSPETGSAVTMDVWELSERQEDDLLEWTQADPARAVFDFPDEPLTYNATVLGQPAVFHYHPARWGTNDFAVTLFVAGQHRYRLHFNSSTAPVTEGEPQVYRTMLESLQLFGQPDGLTEIPTGWEVGAGLVMDTRPIETAAGELVEPATAPLTPLGGLAGVVESWQEQWPSFRFMLLTDAGETYLIRGEPFRVHFRGQAIDYWFNANTVEPPQPGERVTVTGRLIAPNEVVAGDITLERDGLTQTWFSQTLIEIAPYWETEESTRPPRSIVSGADVPHLWLRGSLETMAGYLVAEPEPPTLPAAWQPYADRTALVYGVVNPENRQMEIREVFVQDGPCDVTPATTHCQHWLQIVLETPQAE